jgi:hypothetical protein
MTGDGSDMRDVEPGFKEARDAVVTQVMEVKAFFVGHVFGVDPEKQASPRERRAYRAGRVGEDPIIDARHRLHDGKCWLGQVAPRMVSDFLAGVLHVADEHARMRFVEVCPLDPRDLFLPTSRKNGKSGDAVLSAIGAVAVTFEEETSGKSI